MKKTGFTISFEDGETLTRYLKAPYIEETSFDEEPRWGQLANLNELELEINKALKKFNENEFLKKLKTKYPKFSGNYIRKAVVVEKLAILRDHFEANRQFRYNNKTKGFKEITRPELNIDRYIYTKKAGWIDMHHFAYFAVKSVYNPIYDSSVESYAGEIIQDYVKDNASGFSYEDLVSNRAGNEFGLIFFRKLWNGKIELENAIKEYLISLEPVEPEDAPNYKYIPYAATNKNRVTKFDGKPLIGEELKQATKSAHNNKANVIGNDGISLKDKIEKAHKIIPR